MSGQLPSAILLCGKGRIAVDALHFTVSSLVTLGLQIPIFACPNADDKGHDTWYPSFLRLAKLLDVPVLSQPSELASDANLLLVSLEYDKIIRVEGFASKRLYNLHFSKLPKYRGVYTSIWPILNGETETGVTLHVLDAGIDSGDVIAQKVFDLPPLMNARQLYDEYMNHAMVLYRSWFARLLYGDIQPVPQVHDEATYYSRKSLSLSIEANISLELSAEEIVCRVRAFYFPEYQTARLQGRGVRQAWIVGASPLLVGSKLLENAHGGVYVAGDGQAVELLWV